MTRREEEEGLLSNNDVTFARSNSVTHQKRSKVVLYLFLAVAVVALVVGIVFATSTYVKNHDESDDSVVTAKEDDPASGQERARSDHFRFAAVAPDARDCATIGTNILAQQRGSAVDAAIATLLCNGLHNADSLGVGGGFFMNIYDTPRNGTKKEFYVLDSREVAPLAADKYMFVNTTQSPSEGPLAIAVPGQIAGMWEAWLRFGRVPWKELFQPAIQMARYGMRVDNHLAVTIKSKEKDIREQPSLREIYVHPNGSLVKEGDIITRPKQADSLEVIANEGGTALYTGSLVPDLIADLQDIGSIITEEDLRQYKPQWKEAIKMNLTNGNLTIHAMPPPGGGLILGFILSILNGYNMTSSDLDTYWDKVYTYHHIIEAYKFAYAKRTLMGDPNFVDVSQLVAQLTSPEYAELVRNNITDYSTHNVPYYRPSFEPIVDSGTSHTSVLAPDGAAVAVTSTINTEFGSKRRGTRTGIIFNNQMSDFSMPDDTDEWGLPPSEANFIEPGKRPTSSMSPTLITDEHGEVRVIIGASGGTKITTGVAFALVHHLWLGYSMEDAISLPRIHHQLVPNYITSESKFPQDILDGLKQLGHQVEYSGSHCVVQGISKSCERCQASCYLCGGSCDACIAAACDGRKDGVPDGY